MPEKMSLIKILVPIDFVEETTLALIESKVFHNISRPGKGLHAERARRNMVVIEESLSKIDQYIKIFGGKVLKKETDEINPKPDSVSLFFDEIMEKSKIIDEEFEEILNLYREYETKISELDVLTKYLSYFQDLDIDLRNLFSGENIRIKIVAVSVDKADQFKKELDKRLSEYLFINRSSEDLKEVIGLIIYTSDKETVLNDMIRSFRIRVVEIPEKYERNLSRAYKDLYSELVKMREFLDNIRENARERYEKIKTLFQETYSGLHLLRDFMKIMSHSIFTDENVLIEGFIPSRSKDKVVKKILSATRDMAIIQVRDVGRLDKLEEEPPTYFNMSRWMRPFKMIPDLYGPPSYNEVIPIYIVSITFPIIFGLMFPDLGHGIALLIAGLFMYKYFKDKNVGISDLGLLITYLGISSSVTGFLAGEFFGPATPVARFLEGFYEDLHIHPPLSLPIYKSGAGVVEALYSFILLSVRMAMITLLISSFLGFLNSLINREYDYMFALSLPRTMIFVSLFIPAFFSNDINEVGFFYSYISLGQLLTVLGTPIAAETPMIFEIVKWILNISLLWILIGESVVDIFRHGLREGLSKLSSGFMELFDTVIMAIGNSISYLRIMGIALAHIAVVISFYVPVISLLYSPGILEQIYAWSIYSIGNLLAMTLEAVIAFAHTLRLHLYEMFSKFYRGTGRIYEPFIPITYHIETL